MANLTPNDLKPSPPTSDVCLLLRAHAEQSWLHTELVPVVRELEQGALPEEQLGAALAYLEVVSIEAVRRAAGTDAAYAELARASTGAGQSLSDKARGYHLVVRHLRQTLARRAGELLAYSADAMAPGRLST